MVPVFKPGDHVLTFNWGKIQKGDVIVFKNRGRIYVKRVFAVSGKSLKLVGDNATKSHNFEGIDVTDTVGKVIFRY